MRAFHAVMLAVALGYWLHIFWVTDLTAFGLQFRFLTIWALTAAVIGWALCLIAPGRALAFHSAGTVLSLLVVLLYWRLYFADPANVNGNGPPDAYLEYYVHLAGPVLQALNVILVLRAFRAWRGALVWLLGLFAAYVTWIELLVQPMNDAPAGRVTSGLPYPFLNNMTFDDRAVFYGTTFVTFLIFLALGVVATWIVGRLAPRDLTGANRAA